MKTTFCKEKYIGVFIMALDQIKKKKKQSSQVRKKNWVENSFLRIYVCISKASKYLVGKNLFTIRLQY